MLTKDDLNEIKKLLTPIETDVVEVKERTKKLESTIAKNHKELKQELKYASHMLDKQTIEVSKRVTRIEEHLNLPKN